MLKADVTSNSSTAPLVRVGLLKAIFTALGDTAGSVTPSNCFNAIIKLSDDTEAAKPKFNKSYDAGIADAAGAETQVVPLNVATLPVVTPGKGMIGLLSPLPINKLFGVKLERILSN